MPVSIAPSALAESLDEGWGDDETSDVTASTGPLALASSGESATALAPARVPVFEPTGGSNTEADAKASKAIARASSAVAAAKARRAAAGSASATLTGGFFALPRAATEAKNLRADASGTVAESPDIAPIVSVQASEPTAPSAPIATTETIEISGSPLVQPAVMPSSLPPPVSDDDSDWEVPSTNALAAESVPPTATSTVPPPSAVPPIVTLVAVGEPVLADTGDAGSASSREALTQPEPIAGTATMVSKRVSKSETPKARSSVSPKTPMAPATKTVGAARSEVARASVPPTATARRSTPRAQASAQPNATRDSAVPSEVDLAVAAAPATAETDPQHSTMAAADKGVPHFDPHDAIPAIDITIPPTFPHGGVDPDALSPGAPSAAPKPSSPVSTASEGSSGLGFVEPLSSMSPVTASSAMPRGRSKLWSVVAAAVAIVGLVWGFAGVKQAARSDARKGQHDAVTVVAAPKPQPPAAAAHRPNATPELAAPTAAADSPPTATQAEREAAPLVAEQSAPKKRGRRHYAAAATPSRNLALPANTAEMKAVDSSAPSETASSLSAPTSPQTGIVDPKAFPSNEGAAAAAKVRVEVDPPDSKIAIRGRLATAPYQFEVPKGTRVVLEVARAGYITRRIVLDGSRDFVRIAMIPEPKTQAPAEDAPAPAPAPAPAQDNPAEP